MLVPGQEMLVGLLVHGEKQQEVRTGDRLRIEIERRRTPNMEKNRFVCAITLRRRKEHLFWGKLKFVCYFRCCFYQKEKQITLRTRPRPFSRLPLIYSSGAIK